MINSFILLICFSFILFALFPLFSQESYSLSLEKEILLDMSTSDVIVDPYDARIYVGISCDPSFININCDYGKVSVVNSSNFKVIKNITLPTTSVTLQPIAGPSIKVNSMIYNPNNNKIYVLISTKSTISEDENFIAIINGPSNILINKIIDLGTDTPADSTFDIMNMALNPAKNEIYVTNLESKTLSVINSTSDQVSRIPLDFKPDKIFYNNNKVYVTSSTSPYSLSIYESETFTRIGSIPFDSDISDPQVIAFVPELEKIFIAIATNQSDMSDSMVYLYNSSTFEKIGNVTTFFPTWDIAEDTNNDIYIYLDILDLLDTFDLLSIYDITNQNMFQNLYLYNFYPVDLFLDPINKNILYIFADMEQEKRLLKINTHANIVNGTDGNDHLQGTVELDSIFGRLGNDTLGGLEGTDILYGGEDNDTLDGGVDNDWLVGGKGNDTLGGLEGNDKLVGQEGNDVLVGQGGDDYLRGGIGDDVIDGQEGNDDLIGGLNNDKLEGGEGDDVIGGNSDNDWLSGGPGNDNLRGDSGNDFLSGQEGDDDLRGGTGDDVIEGQEGNDRLDGREDDDWLSGGLGDDRLEGREGNDVLVGQGGNDRLEGREGNDDLRGGLGDDRLEGREGNDVLDGKGGDDDLRGGLDNDKLDGGGGNDVLDGQEGDDELQAGPGNDKIDGGVGNDFLDDQGGNDDLRGGPGNDNLIGMEGDDNIYGMEGDDSVNGGVGDDKIDGGPGNDDLWGTPGNDVLTGGSGTDDFHCNDGNDTITDYNIVDTKTSDCENF